MNNKSNFIQETDVKIIQVPHNKTVDVTGFKVGESGIVLGFCGYINNSARFYVKCSCDRIFITQGRRITGHNGKSPISGCSECGDKRMGLGNINDVTGKRFGRLEVICKSNYKDRHDRIFYICKCDCYNFALVPGESLRRSESQSCGCLQKEICREWMIELSKTQKKENHPCWNSNLTDEERDSAQRRNRVEGKKTAKAIFLRDNFNCLLCNKRGGKLIAHHLDGYNWSISGRFDLTNIVTLCRNCHDAFHDGWGRGNNTRKQFIQFYTYIRPSKTNIEYLNV